MRQSPSAWPLCQPNASASPSWNSAISKYLPSEAGRQLFSLTHDSSSLSPLWGGLLFAGYCAFAIALAAVLLVRRDT